MDKYHFVRQVVWDFEAVRKEEQKKFSTMRRKYFKRSKSLLSKQYNYLTTEQKQQVDLMLYASEKLLKAYSLKELYFEFMQANDSKEAKKLLSPWILLAKNSQIHSFVSCVKVIKRNAYGYRSFERFRKRILHIFNHQPQKSLKSLKLRFE